jgi:cytochrome b pre-mRNA-processing protein 3
MNWLRKLLPGNTGRADRAAVSNLYAAILKRARNPEVFGDDGFADTMDGRTGALAIYTSLVTTRLSAISQRGRVLSSRLTDRVFDDIDAGLRETGVGDASIARKVRTIGERFVGLGIAVNEAFLTSDPQASIHDILERNELTGGTGTANVADDIIDVRRTLEARSDDSLLSGLLDW